MTSRPVPVLLAVLSLACALGASACGSDDSENTQAAAKPAAAKLSAQDNAAVTGAVRDVQSSCGAGQKTPATERGVDTLVRIYQQRGPNAAVQGNPLKAKNLDQVLAAVAPQLAKCGATDDYARMIGARAAKGRF